jgi:pimeloyl-ACP methyl ester carboxylesterase
VPRWERQGNALGPARRRENLEAIKCDVDLLRGGAGPPLLYLHGGGAAGMRRRFHALLAERFEVYLALLDRLGLERSVIVGASPGGRVACELALHAPARVNRLVLLAPVGLALPDPVTPLFRRPREEARGMLFHDQELGWRLSPWATGWVACSAPSATTRAPMRASTRSRTAATACRSRRPRRSRLRSPPSTYEEQPHDRPFCRAAARGRIG